MSFLDHELVEHTLTPNTPEWDAHRAAHFNASEAPAVLGCSPHETRGQMLARLHSGISKEHSQFVQERVLDNGHRIEALARPYGEQVAGVELSPMVYSRGKLSASIDGVTLMGDAGWECKTLNEELRAALPFSGPECESKNDPSQLPKRYRVQMEQQCMVAGLERVLFTAALFSPAGELLDIRHVWYYPDLALRAEIIAGWVQFEADLAEYKPQPTVQPVVAAPVEALPAVSVQLSGALAVVSNLTVFDQALRGFIAKIPAKPATDQEFADTEAACKALKKAEEALESAESNALASMADVNQMRTLVATLRELARTTRLQREKLVEARKKEIREEQVERGRAALAAHIASLNQRLGKPYMPPVAADFGAAIKGLKTVASVVEKIDLTLANAKIEANAIADRIDANLKALRELAADYRTLFADAATLVLKAPDDCRATITSRIAEHTAAAELAERERARIRQEEEARARAKAEADARAAAAAAETQRTLEAAKAPAPSPAPAPAPVAAAPVDANVMPIRKASAPTLRIGEVTQRLGGLGITEAFLRTLGVEPANKERNAVLYHEGDFDRICQALIAHIEKARAVQVRAA